MSMRADALHVVLYNKHASLLNAGYVKAARTSYDYQVKITGGQVQGQLRSPGLAHFYDETPVRIPSSATSKRDARPLVRSDSREEEHKTRVSKGGREGVRY